MDYKYFWLYLTSYIPTKLPVGMTEFNSWVSDVIKLTGPMAAEDSMKYAVCSNIIHLPHTKAYVPKQFFVRTLRKAAANQVASQIFQDIKIKQEAAAKLAIENNEAQKTS